MACGVHLPTRFERVTIPSSTEYQVVWFTRWYPNIGLDEFKGVLRIKGASATTFKARVAVQHAIIRTDNPDGPTLLEADYTSGGNTDRSTGIVDISGQTGGKFWCRLGAAYLLTTGSTPASADLGLELSWDACGKIVGGRTVQLFTPTTDAGRYYEPITPFIPAIHADKVKALLIVTGSFNGFQCQLAYRTATTSKEVPSAWSTNFETAPHVGNGEYNTGEKGLSTAADMWIQFGIEHYLQAGNSNGGANVQALVAVRRTGG